MVSQLSYFPVSQHYFQRSLLTCVNHDYLQFLPSTGQTEERRRARFAISQGFIQRDIKYDWNKLYVLGLHYKTSSDGLKNYIQLISGYEASVLWFKPNGKAIVTLKTDRIKGKHDIRIKVNCSVNQKLGKFGEIQTP